MKIWFPYLRAGSGTDVFTERLADGLNRVGHDCIVQSFPHKLQFCPWIFQLAAAPAHTEIIVTNSWNGFAFRRTGTKLVVVQHLCVHDAALAPYRSRMQMTFHDLAVRRFERRSRHAADLIISVSEHAARSYQTVFGGPLGDVVLNGIDTDFFSPATPFPDRSKLKLPYRLLYVGNLSRRKGADLLPHIMARLGDDFMLEYTTGLRTPDTFREIRNMRPLGRLSEDAVRAACRRATLLLFPSRFEGFGYVAAEAMACGTPVITTSSSAMPEVIKDKITGVLCPVDAVDDFADAINWAITDQDRYLKICREARRHVVENLSLRAMLKAYDRAFQVLVASSDN